MQEIHVKPTQEHKPEEQHHSARENSHSVKQFKQRVIPATNEFLIDFRLSECYLVKFLAGTNMKGECMKRETLIKRIEKYSLRPLTDYREIHFQPVQDGIQLNPTFFHHQRWSICFGLLSEASPNICYDEHHL